MKKLFTLSLLALISMLTFAQNQVKEVVTTDVYANYYADSKDWFIMLSNDDHVFRFDILVKDRDDLMYNHTYTLDDMDPTYSWYGIDTRNAILYTSATLEIKEGQHGDEYEAYVTLGNGESYHVTYVYTPVEITSEMTVEFSPGEIYTFTEDDKFQLVGFKEDGFTAYITFMSNQMPGTYGYSDLIQQNTRVYLTKNDMEGVYCYDIKATITEKKAIVDYYGKNGVLYHLIYNLVNDDVTDAIKDVTTVGQKAQKVLRNGEIRILSAGNEYNAKGMLVK